MWGHNVGINVERRMENARFAGTEDCVADMDLWVMNVTAKLDWTNHITFAQLINEVKGKFCSQSK